MINCFSRSTAAQFSSLECQHLCQRLTPLSHVKMQYIFAGVASIIPVFHSVICFVNGKNSNGSPHKPDTRHSVLSSDTAVILYPLLCFSKELAQRTSKQRKTTVFLSVFFSLWETLSFRDKSSMPASESCNCHCMDLQHTLCMCPGTDTDSRGRHYKNKRAIRDSWGTLRKEFDAFLLHYWCAYSICDV